MVQSVTRAELNVAGGILATEGISKMYSYLADKGFNYARLADGVALGNSLSGEAAISYMKSIAKARGKLLTEAAVDKIRLDMAYGYLNTIFIGRK